MRDLITLVESKSASGKIMPDDLSYSDSALAPILSANNLKQHQKLWHSYCHKYNDGIGDKQYNYAGYFLHTLFFTQFRSARNNNKPNGPIGNFIKSKFKEWDDFKDKIEDAATNFHGSGWIYLARDGSIKTIVNHQLRQDIVILIDLWEHSYIPDYGTNKAKYIDNIWKIMDWNIINSRFMAPYRT
jgi:Fe-Mn family superoxide dismutase